MIISLLLSFYISSASNITVDRIPSTGTPPIRRIYAGCVYFQGQLYFFGGRNTSGTIINEFHAFNISTEIWQRFEPIDDIAPMGRIVFAMYASNSEIFVHGGHGPNGILNDLWSYDPEVNIWSKIEQQGDVPPPFYRPGYTHFTYNNIKYFAIGFFATINKNKTDDLYLYDTTTKTWRKMPKNAKSGHSVPLPRRTCNMNYYNGFLYLWGGNLYEDNTGAQLYRYDLSSQQWEAIKVTGKLPQTRILFNSGIYNDYLYIFPGWVTPLQKDIDETFRFDLTQLENPDNAVWEELQIQQVDDYSTYLPRDSYSGYMVDNIFYIHGGYSAFYPLGNFIIKLELDQSPIGLMVIGTSVDIPSNRYFSSLTLISGKFYMFGGSTGSKVLDDLWVYDEDQVTWSLKDTIGLGPGPRQGHAAVALGNSLMIWGGKNGSNFYQDLHMYNTITNIWEVVEIKSTINPTGAEGGCMEVQNDDLYIFGGKNEFRANNYLWKFNLGSNEYTLLSAGLYNSPTAVAYSTCYSIENKMYFMYGSWDNTDTPDSITIFDLETNQWSKSELSISNRHSNVASGQVGSSIIVANGARWGNWCVGNVWIINMETNNIEHILDLDWKTFAESSVYYKNSLYVFGGGDSLPDGAIRETRSVDRFYKINFPDMPCSVGTYSLNNECTPCPKGTYKDMTGPNEWIKCAKGTFNEQIGATNVRQCMPCPEGTFNSQEGQYFCVKCDYGSTCPAGSATLRIKNTHGNEYSDVLPDEHESDEKLVTFWALQALLIITIVLSFLMCVVLFAKQLRRIIPRVDIFMYAHTHDENTVMKTRRTLIGGLSSLIVFGAIAFLTVQALLYFYYDNIEEIKSLIPIVVVNEYAETIKGTINIQVSFGEYGGQCVNDKNECMPEITYTKTNISGRLSTLSCLAVESECMIELTCEHCVLGKSAQVLFSSLENSSYATSIKVAISSQSSVPGFDSQIKIRQSVENGEVFRGSEPTVFHFNAIPSIFESEITNEVSQETGYHLALGDSSKQGSSYTVENLSKTRNLHTQITFSQGYSALQTKRTYKIRNNVLIIGLIGGIAGVFELVQLIMRQVEDVYETCLRNWNKQELKRKIIPVQRTLTTHQTEEDEEVRTSMNSPIEKSDDPLCDDPLYSSVDSDFVLDEFSEAIIPN